ncbi:hypothetical protein HPB50_017294 [Hyalomma asiaticum]|uniref:Uncharacterized protein n=1 Tax=Hyalomma asiaticum TaxID=266040 RepID=A0ACB7RJL0_HYAAI|nr:hypothetical protein HPB50_017294 [Hyalomma asiaticum]
MRNLEPLDSLPVRLWSRDGTVVPRVDSVRILGLWIDVRGCNGGAIKRLGGQASNILRLISRITSRREARARAILRSVGSDAKAALFVDAAEYSTRRAFGVSVVDGKGQLVARASVCTDQVTVAEEIAIALALQAALRGLLGFTIGRPGLLWRFDFAAGGTAPSEWSQAGEVGRWSSYLLVSSARRGH